MLGILRKKLCAKFKKCEFWLKDIAFPRHIVLKDEISVDLVKVEAVVNWKRPTIVTEVQTFLGLVGYYRKFIEIFSKTATPLTQLTRKKHIVRVEW